MWKKFVLTLAGFASITTIGIMSGIFYLSHQTQKLPNWFETSTPITIPITHKTQITPSKPISANQVWMRVHQTPYIPGRSTLNGSQWKQVDLNAQELNAVLFNSPNPSDPRAFSSILKDSNVRIADGNIIIGAIVNMQKMTQELGDGQRSRAFQGLSNILAGNNGNMYVEIAGKPVIGSNHTIALAEDARIKLANFNFTITEFAQYTGISENFLRDRLGFVSSQNPDNSRGHRIVPMMIENVEIIDDKLRLSGTGTAW